MGPSMKTRWMSALSSGLLCVALAGAVGATANAEASVAITRPTDGQSFDGASATTMRVAGTASFSSPNETVLQTFHLAEQLCNPMPGIEVGQGELASGDPTGAAVCGAYWSAAKPLEWRYVSGDLNLILERDGVARLTVVTDSFVQDVQGAGGVGIEEVQARILNQTSSGQHLLGSATASKVVLPHESHVTHVLEVPLDADDQRVERLTLELELRGAAGRGYVRYGTQSYLEVPVVETGQVHVSINEGPREIATMLPDGEWEVILPTPRREGEAKVTATALKDDRQLATDSVVVVVE